MSTSSSHLRLVETASSLRSPLREARKKGGACVTGDERDIEAMLADPVNDLLRDMDRLIARQGPLPPACAVEMTWKIASAILEARQARRYLVRSTHVRWLGSVLYYALTGRAPLAPGQDVSSSTISPPVTSLSPHPISPEIEAIVTSCLTTDPGTVLPSMDDLENALAALAGAERFSGWEIREERDAENDDEARGDSPTIPPASGVSLTSAGRERAPTELRAARAAGR